MRARCPRMGEIEDPHIVTKAQCQQCEQTHGPCDYAETVQGILTALERIYQGLEESEAEVWRKTIVLVEVRD